MKLVSLFLFLFYSVNLKIYLIKYQIYPSYKTKQADRDGKSVYQDVCYPITKEFREKLYDTLKEAYEQAKEQKQEEARGSVSNDVREQIPDKDTPLR